MSFLFNRKKKKFFDLKIHTPLSNYNPISSMDVIEIDKISSNGIFCSCGNIYSESFLMEDLNYVTNSFNEQLYFLGEWCHVLNSFSTYVEITIFNRNRNMETLRKDILYRKKYDAFDESRSAYNDIIESKILNGRQGIEQIKIVTVSVVKQSYEDAKSYLATVEANMKKEFLGIGSMLIPLNGTERLRLLHNFWRKGEENLFTFSVEDYMNRGICDWKNDIAPSYVDFETCPDRFFTDKGVYSAYYIAPDSYPSTSKDGFYEELVNINRFSIFTMTFVSIPKDCVISTLEDKLQAVEREINRQQQARNRSRNFSSEISLKTRTDKKDLEGMINDITNNDQETFWIDFSFILYGENEKKLENARDSVLEVVDKYSMQIKPYINWQRQAVNTALPIGVRQVKESRTMFTQTAGIFLPFRAAKIKGRKNPFYYGIGQIDKDPILVNRKYDLMNGNGFVFGVPGSGKSFTGAKMEMGSVILNTEDNIIIIDPTLEYADVAQAFGGSIINLATYTKNFLNPLEVKLEELTVNDENGMIKDKCGFMASLCQECMEGDISASQKGIVERVAKNIYLEIAKKPLKDRRQLKLSDFVKELTAQKEKKYTEDLVIAMERFTDGSLNIFNHETNVDLNNRMIVICVRDLPEDLYSIAMLCALEFVKNKILENYISGIATWLYVDEFHEMIKHKLTELYMVSLWAKVRKLGGLCTGLTQNIIRLMEKEITKTLVCNSEYVMFLKQGQPDIDEIMKNFESISPAMSKYMKNADKGTGLVKFDSKVIPFDNKVDADNPLYDVFNTNFHEKQEKLKRKNLKEKGEDYRTA